MPWKMKCLSHLTTVPITPGGWNRAAHTGWLEPCSSDRVAGEGPLYAVCVEDAELVVVSGADFGGWSTATTIQISRMYFRFAGRFSFPAVHRASDFASEWQGIRFRELIRVVPRLLCSRWFSLVV